MKKTTIVGLGLILALALVATVALAWGPGFGPRFGRGFGGPAYGSPPIPNLTAEQSSKIQTLRETFLKESEPFQKALLAKKIELRNHWPDPKTDPATITAEQKEIWDLQSKLQERAANLRLEVRKVLTPEQLAQLPGFSQGAGFAPGAGFGPRGFGSPMSVRGPMGRW
jgi:Spy/CpxP family protein refolding chaperone